MGLPGKRNCLLHLQGCWSPGQRQRILGMTSQQSSLGACLEEQRAQGGVRHQAGHGDDICMGMFWDEDRSPERQS